jgi:hypothetical protein
MFTFLKKIFVNKQAGQDASILEEPVAPAASDVAEV